MYVTYKVDAHDSLVGHVVGWINEMAACMESIEIICLAAGQAELAENVRVHSLGKEHGRFRVARWIRFLQTVWQLRNTVEAVFCQFSPEYVHAIAPLAKWRNWPIILWYTHRHVGWRLRLATVLADKIVTASPDSFGIDTPKLRVIGHGIDTKQFKPGRLEPPEHPVILAVGRLSPIKNYELLIDATAILVKQYGQDDIRGRIIGRDEGNAPPRYAQQLQRRIDRAGLTGVISLVGSVPHSQVVREYQQATVNVNLCPTGGMDKAVLEGMAVGLPTLVMNLAFAPLVGNAEDIVVVRSNDAHAVASHLFTMLNLSNSERQQLGEALRQTVVKNHDQKRLVKRLAAVVQELVA